MEKLLLSRRTLLKSMMGAALGATSFAALPFGLTADDLRPLVRGRRYDLEPLDQLVLQAFADGKSDGEIQCFGALGDVIDDVPFYTVRVPAGHTYHGMLFQRAGVVVRADPNLRVYARTVGVDLESEEE